MARVQVADIKPETPCTISGWVERFRDSKYMIFLVIKDITGKIQVTIEKEKLPNIVEQLKGVIPNSVVSISGVAHLSEYVKMGGIEFIPDDVKILSIADALPIMTDANLDNRLDFRYIDLRSDKNILMFQVQSLFTNAMREFLVDNNFIEIHSPKLIAAASESGSDVFEVKYFDQKAYLAQSPQFYKQMAMASGFEKIFESGPVFRAEQSFTNRHATEFSGFDIEFSYIDSVKDVMSLEEDLIIYALQKVKNKYGEQIKQVFETEVVVPTKPFPTLTLNQVFEELSKNYNYVRTEDDKFDLSTEAERLIKQLSNDKYGHEFMFVTDFPKEKRAFYHMRENGMPQGYDLIWKGVEITTGAQREHRYEILKQQAEEKGLAKDVEFYLDFFKHGCPPHGGFGLGLDRITMLLLNIATIKEVQFLFRGPNRITP